MKIRKLPKDVEKFFKKIRKELLEVLGSNLFGLYISGSLTYGNFRTKSSDLDCMVVTKRKLNSQELDRLEKWHGKLMKENNRPAKRLEMLYATRNGLLSSGDMKTPVFYKETFKRRAVSGANNKIIWLNIREQGITIFGPEPREFVPPISAQDLRHALRSELDYLTSHTEEYLREDWSKVYVILTLCRILHTLETGEIVSKLVAASWCLEHAPKKYHALITAAMRVSRSAHWKTACHPNHGISERHRKEILNFQEYVSRRLRRVGY